MNIENIDYVLNIPQEELDAFYTSITDEFPILLGGQFKIGGSMCWMLNTPNDIDLIFRIPEGNTTDNFDIIDLQNKIKAYINKEVLIIGKKVDIMVFIIERWENRLKFISETMPDIYSRIKDFPEYDYVSKIAVNFTLNTPVYPKPNGKMLNQFTSPLHVKYDLYK